jgi:hypothetical protein
MLSAPTHEWWKINEPLLMAKGRKSKSNHTNDVLEQEDVDCYLRVNKQFRGAITKAVIDSYEDEADKSEKVLIKKYEQDDWVLFNILYFSRIVKKHSDHKLKNTVYEEAMTAHRSADPTRSDEYDVQELYRHSYAVPNKWHHSLKC